MKKSTIMLYIGVMVNVFTPVQASTFLYGEDTIKRISTMRPGTYYIHVGAYKYPSNAKRQASLLRSQYNYPVVVRRSTNSTLSIVTVGPVIIKKSSNTTNTESQAFSGKIVQIKPVQSNRQLVGQLSVGATWSKAGETRTFYLNPTLEKSYQASKKQKGMPSGELFLGIQQALFSQVLGQFGLVVASTGNASVDGFIWGDADPQYNDHSYHYTVRNTRIGVKGRALLDKRGQKLMPYVSASANIGFNRSHGYTNTPLIFEASPNNNFASNTKTAFSYTLGTGVQTRLNNHWHAGIGYEFLDFGKSALNRTPGQTMNSGLSLSHLYTHSLLLHLSHVA